MGQQKEKKSRGGGGVADVVMLLLDSKNDVSLVTRSFKNADVV